MIIKLAPSVRLPYKQIKGSLAQRQQAAIEVVDKLYRKLYPKFDKNRELPRMGFELIKQERGKHAAKLKSKKLRIVNSNQ